MKQGRKSRSLRRQDQCNAAGQHCHQCQFPFDRKVSQIHEITSRWYSSGRFRQTEQPGAYSQTSLFSCVYIHFENGSYLSSRTKLMMPPCFVNPGFPDCEDRSAFQQLMISFGMQAFPPKPQRACGKCIPSIPLATSSVLPEMDGVRFVSRLQPCANPGKTYKSRDIDVEILDRAILLKTNCSDAGK